MKKVNVVIDNKSDQTDVAYTYLCPKKAAIIGNIVDVPFGRGNKERRACIIEVLQDDIEELVESELKKSELEKPESSKDKLGKSKIKYKKITGISEISITAEMIETARWMKERYFCRLYDCLELFLPPGEPPKRKPKEIQSEAIQENKKIEKLTNEQNAALKEISKAIVEKEQSIFLLHGVTGSGKTQVYISAIQEMVDITGKTAIVMVPEISLTKQVIDRFTTVFGKEKIAVLHSKLTKKQRYEQWEKIRNGEIKIVIGARSAIFAPLDNIGIVVLDEEHESTYKSDKTPKYDALEIAIKRTKKFGGSVILGSATPSVVSYQRAKEGIYKYIPMTQRYNNNSLPEVDLVDITNELKEGNRSIVSRELYSEMKENLDRGKQIILFLNRRGYATYIACKKCDYVAKCEVCDINLIYHKETNSWECHYCGRKIKNTKICPACKEESIVNRGYGTEKVEEEVQNLFADKVVGRLDFDTSQKAGVLEKTLRNFAKGKIDILMGTQIVAKGLDFHNVGLVGVLSADIALNIPDYRSAEKCFQLITQAAGRAGRGEEKGQVIVQTFNPENYAIVYGAKQNYEDFFKKEIGLREYLKYPPFSDIVSVVISSKEKELSEYWAHACKTSLEKMLGEEAKDNIYDPMEMISLNKELSKFYVLVKSPREDKPRYMGALKALRNSFLEKKSSKKFAKYELQISIDINPNNLWRE